MQENKYKRKRDTHLLQTRMAHLRESPNYIALAKEFAVTNIKIKYKRSMFGLLWVFLKPASMVAVFYTLFVIVLGIQTENYLMHLFLGVLLWNFFVESTSDSMYAIIAQRKIIKNIYFHKDALILSACFTATITLGIHLCVYVALTVLLGQYLSIGAILMFLVLMGVLFILTTGISYILGAYVTKFEDLLHIWELVTRIGFFAVPITYTIEQIPSQILPYYMVNPLAHIIHYMHQTMLMHTFPTPTTLGVLAAIGGIAYVIGRHIYRKRSVYFAEEL